MLITNYCKEFSGNSPAVAILYLYCIVIKLSIPQSTVFPISHSQSTIIVYLGLLLILIPYKSVLCSLAPYSMDSVPVSSLLGA